MTIQLIDTATPHEVTIDGTVFTVRALDWGESNNWAHLARKMIPEFKPVDIDGSNDVKVAQRELVDADHWVTPVDRDRLMDMLLKVVTKVEGFDKVSDVLPRMAFEDILVLGSKIDALSKLTKEEEKN